MTDKLRVAAATSYGVSLLFALATLQRFRFWFDESYSSALSTFSVSQLIDLTAADVHPPLYYLLLKGWATLFGNSDFALRIMSLLPMYASIVVLYFLVKRLFTQKAAYLAVICASFGPFMMRYAQETRMYGWTSFLLVSATLILVVQMAKPIKDQSTRIWALYGVIIALAIYSHYFSGLIMLTHWLYVLSQTGQLRPKIPSFKAIKSYLLVNCLIIGLYAPWIPTLLRQFQDVSQGFWIGSIDQFSIPDTFVRIISFNSLNSSSPVGIQIIGLAGFIAITAWLTRYVLQQKQAERSGLALLYGSIVVPIIALFMLSALPMVSSVYYHRYFAQFAVLFYGAIGATLYSLFSNGKRQLAVAVSALLIVVQLGGLRLVYLGTDTERAPIGVSDLLPIVNDSLKDRDAILVPGLWEYYDVWHYNDTDLPLHMIEPNYYYGSLQPIIENDGYRDSFEAFAQEYDRAWILQTDRSELLVPPTSWVQVGETRQNSEAALKLYRTN